MKTILILLTFILSTSFLHSQSNPCYKNLRKGKFTYAQDTTITIIRTKRKQTEIYNEGKSKLILKVEWPNDSTYILWLEKEINAPGCMNKGDWIKTTITGCNDESYTCRFTSQTCGEGRAVVKILD